MSQVLLSSPVKTSHFFAAVLFSPDYYTSLTYYENNWGAARCPCLHSFQNAKAMLYVSTLLDYRLIHKLFGSLKIPFKLAM